MTLTHDMFSQILKETWEDPIREMMHLPPLNRGQADYWHTLRKWKLVERKHWGRKLLDPARFSTPHRGDVGSYLKQESYRIAKGQFMRELQALESKYGVEIRDMVEHEYDF